MNNVALCSQRQQRILAHLLPALAAGGTLIYSTCSYSVEEDEAILTWLSTQEGISSIPLEISPEWNIVASKNNGSSGYRFYPDKLEGEGFFIAAFHKDSGTGFNHKRSKFRYPVVAKEKKDIVQSYLLDPAFFDLMEHEDRILAIPAGNMDDVRLLQKNLYIRKAGLEMGSLAQRELIPSHSWAMSTDRTNAFPIIRLSLEQALDYLRKKDPDLADIPKGWLLVSYDDIVLGLIKSMPGRMNNYYPAAWRILNK